jgi:hypothetical protein
LFAYRYATTAIVVIARLIGICASGIHAAPNRVNARFRHAMLAPTISQILVVETTARFTVTRSQSIRINRFFCTAIAPAAPLNMCARFSGAVQDEPTTESLTGYIFESPIAWDILGLHKKFTFLLPSPGTLARRLGTFIVGLYYSTDERFGLKKSLSIQVPPPGLTC